MPSQSTAAELAQLRALRYILDLSASTFASNMGHGQRGLCRTNKNIFQYFSPYKRGVISWIVNVSVDEWWLLC